MPRYKMEDEKSREKWREQKRLQRAKKTPAAIEEQRRKERERWHERRRKGLVKTVDQMNKTELKKVRKVRRESNKRYVAKKKKPRRILWVERRRS